MFYNMRLCGIGMGSQSSADSLLDYEDSTKIWFIPYHFSIVIYTTLGFGAIKPKTLTGELIVSSEVILRYTTLGLLLLVLA